eukprot:TRINITY_DN1284_c2_g2_i1.p1 TRINITY_DN1284_c2_g2~~TRINITY_DN1284_c2_g2_i1.p1  ORF type:complete len:761 (+),score=173.92 TRINITY_DN1284_c2_g2_i1:292-2283(+)
MCNAEQNKFCALKSLNLSEERIGKTASETMSHVISSVMLASMIAQKDVLVIEYNKFAENLSLPDTSRSRFMNLGIYYSGVGRWNNATETFDKALAEALTAYDQRTEEECRMYKLFNLFYQGKFSDSLLDEIISLEQSSQTRGDLQLQYLSLSLRCFYFYCMGRKKEFLASSKLIDEFLLKGIELDTSTTIILQCILALSFYHQHKEQKCFVTARSALKLLKQSTVSSFPSLSSIPLNASTGSLTSTSSSTSSPIISSMSTHTPIVYYMLFAIDGLSKIFLLWRTNYQGSGEAKKLAIAFFDDSLAILEKYCSLYPIGVPYMRLWQGLNLFIQYNVSHLQIESIWETGLNESERFNMKWIDAMINYWWGRTSHVNDSVAMIKSRWLHLKFFEQYMRDIKANISLISHELIVLPEGREIFESVRQNNLILTENLIKFYHQDVNASEMFGRKPLHWASLSGHHKMAELLCEYNADVNTKDERMWTPLHWACNGNHLELVKVLIKWKADRSTRTIEGKLPLDLTTDQEIIKLVKLNDTNFDSSLDIWPIIEMGDLKSLQMLFLREDPESILQKRNIWNRTALHTASMFGKNEIVECLLQHQAEVNVCDTNGWTALHWACNNNFPHIIEKLLMWNANAFITNNRNKTAFDLVETNHKEIVQIFNKYLK